MLTKTHPGRVADGVHTTYTYHAMSHLASLTDANGHATTIHYDGYGRVDTVNYPSGAFPSTGETFTYDAAGVY
jgi:YD repeat-containing protein